MPIKNRVTYKTGDILSGDEMFLVLRDKTPLLGNALRKYGGGRWYNMKKPDERRAVEYFFYDPQKTMKPEKILAVVFTKDFAEAMIDVGNMASRMRKTTAVPSNIFPELGEKKFKGIVESWGTTKNDFTTVYTEESQGNN